MNETKWLEFDCQQCGELIEAKEERLGKLVGCPCCLKTTKVELPLVAPQEDVRKAPQRRGPNDKDVPIKLGISKLGSLETTLSKTDAAKTVHTLLGGLMVALGVIVCMMFGIKPPMLGVKPPMFGVKLPKMR